ncbi:MAG TPA: GNAT family N-acetyltransferase [Thermoanaerobaculia bacterium]
MTEGLRIRAARADDAAWLLPMSSRLHDFGPPPFRPRDQMDRAVAADIAASLGSSDPSVAVLVVEDEASGRPLGFAHVKTFADYFTAEPHGHVSDLVVAADSEGRGVGGALLAAAEAWSRARGHRLLTLNVFDENDRARRLYDRIGYRPDTLRMVKVLAP